MASEHSINAVVEIPAGTNTKYEYDSELKIFAIDQENGKNRRIDFLPYPANYGFIPSTLAKPELGGDGDALDVLIIAESLPTGTVIESIPIALLKLIDDGEVDYKIIAIPSKPNLQIVRADTFKKLVADYAALPKVVELWFLHYNPKDESSVEGWGDEKEALEQIKIHLKS